MTAESSSCEERDPQPSSSTEALVPLQRADLTELRNMCPMIEYHGDNVPSVPDPAPNGIYFFPILTSPFECQRQLCSISLSILDTETLLPRQESTNSTHKFFIERAVTNKARCRACHRRIEFNEWRFGVSISKRVNNPEPFKTWHHITCLHTTFSQPQKFAKFVTNPDLDIRDWCYIDKDVQLMFIDELIKLKNIVQDNLTKRRPLKRKLPACGKQQYRSVAKINDVKVAQPEATPTSLSLPTKLFVTCCERFAAISNPSDDSLAAFDVVRRCLAELADVKERTNVLRLWFSRGRDGRGFRGDVRLWFRVLVSDSMNRSFGIKNKQLTKFFATKILHIPLGTIEAKVREMFLRSNHENPPDPDSLIWHSRSSERRTSNKYLPSLLVDMIRRSSHCKFVPKEKSTILLADAWSQLERIAALNKEAARNQLLHALLNECCLDDVEPMLRLLFSESNIRLSLRQLLNAFEPRLYGTWFKQANQPKPNVYNEKHLQTLERLVDFNKICSYDYTHLTMAATRVDGELAFQQLSREKRKSESELSSPSCKRLCLESNAEKSRVQLPFVKRLAVVDRYLFPDRFFYTPTN